MDASLHSKFDKVEQIGKGEFSTVYRVAQTDYHCPMDMGTTTPSHSPGQSPARGQIFAVKKSKHPFIGHKDREAKLREVHILQALTHAEHVVRYIDHWEEHLHLYIQTEFCEEGTLATFLSTVGRGGRLDDFRIFKILQDLSLVSFQPFYLPPCISANIIGSGYQGNSRRRFHAPRYEACQHPDYF
jgi:mitosis inhibitor protein kinase SWE1